MTAKEKIKNTVDEFVLKGEETFIFACHAAVPLVLTPDLLYQLWNNFKQYYYKGDSGNFYRITHIAISDLLLSPLCHKVGIELYEIRKEYRPFLLQYLDELLGTQKKLTIAAFLEDYARLEHRYTQRKELKNVHLLTAQSLLDPAKMEQQIIQFINGSSSDAERLNYLSLHSQLLPEKFESALQVTEVDGDLNTMLVTEEDPSAAGVLHISLPAGLRHRVNNIITAHPKQTTPKENQKPDEPKISLAEQLIAANVASGNDSLDLGKCGLTDSDFQEGSPVDRALRTCRHLEMLVLSNSWRTAGKGDLQHSVNSGAPNLLNQIPLAVGFLQNLRILILSGDETGPVWGVDKIPPLDLPLLIELHLRHNQISDPGGLSGLNALQFLFLSYNRIREVNWLSSLYALEEVDLDNNQITDLRPLLIAFVSGFPRLQLDNNPISSPPPDIYRQGTAAIIDYLTSIDSSSGNEPAKAPWRHIYISASDTSDQEYTKLIFSETFPLLESSAQQSDTISLPRKTVARILINSTEEKDFSTYFTTMLLPPAIRGVFFEKEERNILLHLDAYSAIFPWERLKNPFTRSEPLAVSMYMMRQLPVNPGLAGNSPGPDNRGVIVVDMLSEKDAIQWERTAGVITDILEQNNFRARHLHLHLQDSDFERLAFLLNSPFRLLYLTGIRNPQFTGELTRLKSCPELVIIDISGSAETDIATHFLQYGAKALILLNGNQRFEVSETFCSSFFKDMALGEPFARAVFNARRAVYIAYGEASACAWQCYGDPAFVFSDFAKKDKKRENTVFLSVFPGLNEEIKYTTIFFNRVMDKWQEKSNTLWQLTYDEITPSSDTSVIRGTVAHSEIVVFITSDILSPVQYAWVKEAGLRLSKTDFPYIFIFSRENPQIADQFKAFLFSLSNRHQKKVIIDSYYSLPELLIVLSHAIDLFTHDDQPEARLIDPQILEWAQEYEFIRKTQPGGFQRTLNMNVLADRMAGEAKKIQPFLPQLTKSKSAGMKLAAIACLQNSPDLLYALWLAGCIGDDEKPFIGLRAAVSLKETLRPYRKKFNNIVFQANKKALANMYISLYKDPNQIRQLKEINDNVKGRASTPSGMSQFEYDLIKEYIGSWEGSYEENGQKINFYMNIWLEEKNRFTGVIRDDTYYGKSDISGEIFVTEQKISFVKKYRRRDVDNYGTQYTGYKKNTMQISGFWEISSGVRGAFEMKMVTDNFN